MLELDAFDSFDSIVPSLFVDDLASFSEGDGDGERDLGRCCGSGNDPEAVDPEDEGVT